MKKLLLFLFSIALSSLFMLSCQNEKRTKEPGFVIKRDKYVNYYYNLSRDPYLVDNELRIASDTTGINFVPPDTIAKYKLKRAIILQGKEPLLYSVYGGAITWDTTKMFDFDKKGKWETQYFYDYYGKYEKHTHNVKDTSFKSESYDYWIGNKHFLRYYSDYDQDSIFFTEEYNVVNDTGYLISMKKEMKYFVEEDKYKYDSKNNRISSSYVSTQKEGFKDYGGKVRKSDTTVTGDELSPQITKDNKGRITKIQEQDGSGSEFFYDSIGRITKINKRTEVHNAKVSISSRDTYIFIYKKNLLEKVFEISDKYNVVQTIKYNEYNLPILFETKQYDASESFMEDYQKGKVRGYGVESYKIIWIK